MISEPLLSWFATNLGDVEGRVMYEPERLMTAEEVAEFLRVNRFRVYEMARTGVIPVVRMGRQIRFAPNALHRWILDGGTPLDAKRLDIEMH